MAFNAIKEYELTHIMSNNPQFHEESGYNLAHSLKPSQFTASPNQPHSIAKPYAEWADILSLK